MKPAGGIVLLDPSLWGEEGETSPNLGDVIIREAVEREVRSLFPGAALERVASHPGYGRETLARVNRAGLRLVGGTNLLSSSKVKYTWCRDEGRWGWLFPRVRPVALIGVGWGVGYPEWRDPKMKTFYRRALARGLPHSVRDGFSARMLEGIGVRGVWNTSCPTVWGLGGFVSAAPEAVRAAVFTVTDYRKAAARDDGWLRALAAAVPGRLFLFPQGPGDVDYWRGTPGAAEYGARVEVLPREVAALDRWVEAHRGEGVYVGTRLHGGIRAMAGGMASLIVPVDHRAREIGADVGLPLVPEEEGPTFVARWVRGEERPGPIRVPEAAIAGWRDAWRARVGA